MTMAPLRAKQTTTTTGTGTITLIAAATNVRSFNAALGSSSVVTPYVLSYSGGFEIGIGTYDGGSPGTLTRTSIIASSNSGSAVSLPAGTTDVTIPFMPGLRGRTTGTGSDLLNAAGQTGIEYVWTGSSAETLTLGAAASMPAGPTLLVRNEGTALLTIDANSTETIGGVLTCKLNPGDWVELGQRGGNWDAWGVARITTVFTTTGTWTKNPLSQFVKVRSWGAGGGGGAGTVVAAATACSGGGGGGGAGYAETLFAATDLAASYTATIGVGGAGGTSPGGHGSAGGETRLGSLVGTRAFGGGGGAGGASGANSGGGGGGMLFGVGSNATSGTGATAASSSGASGGSGAGSGATVGTGCGTGGAGGASGSAGSLPGQPANGSQGGASGGGIDGANAAQAGGSAGWGGATRAAAGTAPGGAGGTAGAHEAGQIAHYGGGGGGAAISANGGAGGAGQVGGGGGGGGGSTQTGFAGGAGGVGGAGMMIIDEW